MTRDTSKKRVQDERELLDNTTRPAKRAKNASESHRQKNNGGHLTQRKLNRLQRAIPKEMRQPAAQTGVLYMKLKRAEKKKGLLAKFMDSPIDIFYEVLSHSLPADLLSLSRVSHQLRKLLLSRSSRQIWTTSFALTDIPPCPKDLTEPQYASLVFDTECVACGAPHIRTIQCEFRLRICKDCYSLNIVDCDTAFEEFTASLSSNIRTEVLEEVKDIAISTTPYIFDKNNCQLFYRPDLLDAFKVYLLYYLKQSPEKLDSLIRERLQVMHEISLSASELQNWLTAKAVERSSELQELSQQHEENVKSRLIELGYAEEDWTYEIDWLHHEDVKKWEKMACQKRKLTERTWKTLLPKLREFLDERRQKIVPVKREKEFRKQYGTYSGNLCMTFGERMFLPEPSDIMQCEVVKNFMFPATGDREITPRLWSIFLPKLEEVIRAQKQQAIDDHVSILSEVRSLLYKGGKMGCLDPAEQLSLASSFFHVNNRGCTKYEKSLYYFISTHSVGLFDGKLRGHDFYETPWMSWGYNLDIQPIIVGLADALLADLDLPLTTKMYDMQAMGDCFVCCRCAPVFRKVMGWSEIVRHYISEMEIDSSACKKTKRMELGIQLIKDHSPSMKGELLKIVTEEEKIAITEDYEWQSECPKTFDCNLCPLIGIENRDSMTEDQIELHILIKHGKWPDADDYENSNIFEELLAFFEDF